MKKWISPQIKELNIENTACKDSEHNPFAGSSGVTYPVRNPSKDSGPSGPSGESGSSGYKGFFGGFGRGWK